jgi:LCP family protein required for cell wall assembly
VANQTTFTRRTALGVGAAGALGLLGIRPALAQESGVYTFAVIGTDFRTPDDPELSDVIKVARVNTTAKTVRTLAIPRDLYVEIPGVGWGKINSAYATAIAASPNRDWRVAAQSTMDTISHMFGLTLDGVAQTDMQVFPQIVDAVGGVTVNNPTAVADGTFAQFPAGEITLTGEEAIRFCRTRKADSDDARVHRQHLVLQGILVKLQDPAMITRVPELIATLSGGAVRYDIAPAVQAELIALLPQLSSESLAFTNIADQLWPGYSAGGAWIYEGDWATLPGYVQSWLAG